MLEFGNIMLMVWLSFVFSVISLCLCLYLIWYFRKYGKPMIKWAYGVISSQGVEARKKIEIERKSHELAEALTPYILEKLSPEAKAIFELIPEDIKRMVMENPEAFLILIQRFSPLLEKLTKKERYEGV